MRPAQPFNSEDLAEMDDTLYSKAAAVVALREVHAGNRRQDVIGLRHDVDAGHAFATALKMAEWEAERGYRSTYFVLHTSPYWGSHGFREGLERIALLGHEIGIHTNALAEALRTGVDPDVILDDAIAELRSYGHTITGVAGHGDPFCNRDRGQGEITFANDEQFVECARPKEGEPDREITRGSRTLRLQPRNLEHFGLSYEALCLGLPDPWRNSDSGGKWLSSFEDMAGDLGTRFKQLHLLIHPDWWGSAFTPAAVAA